METVLQHGYLRWRARVCGLVVVPVCLCAMSAGAARWKMPQPAASQATTVVKQGLRDTTISANGAGAKSGCRDGWRRVGTQRDPTLKRIWAVVANCNHPAWPARLEPASEWKAMPQRIPAGSRVVVTSAGDETAMQLEGKTVEPGYVGQSVGVRLINRRLVRARLVAPGRVEIESMAGWRER